MVLPKEECAKTKLCSSDINQVQRGGCVVGVMVQSYAAAKDVDVQIKPWEEEEEYTEGARGKSQHTR